MGRNFKRSESSRKLITDLNMNRDYMQNQGATEAPLVHTRTGKTWKNSSWRLLLKPVPLSDPLVQGSASGFAEHLEDRGFFLVLCIPSQLWRVLLRGRFSLTCF